MPLSHKLAVEIALAYGFIPSSQRGSHQYFVRENAKVTIPFKKEFPIGTAKSILQEIAITNNETRRDIVKAWSIKL